MNYPKNNNDSCLHMNEVYNKYFKMITNIIIMIVKKIKKNKIK